MKPHFLLFSESTRQQARGQWRFVLQAVDGSDQFEAFDEEPNVGGERLELLAVVRGLEALPEPARVTLVTPSKYVNRGLSQGLPEWRHNGWQWEHFGEMVPVKNRDLWQRVDRALDFHQVQCRSWRFDLPHGGPAAAVGRPPAAPSPAPPAERAISRPGRWRLGRRLRRLSLGGKRLAARTSERFWLELGRLGTGLVPIPWLE
ncbi:MAG TPA: RNase H family protein [Pirellulales bacterium]|nr:RNase H family protein [Pirellulales bacterium]